MFTKSLADAYKSRAGRKYRPSNGTEGDMFMREFCEQCKHDDGEDKLCEIIALSMSYDVEHDEYPVEWQYGKDGQPLCVKYENEEK